MRGSRCGLGLSAILCVAIAAAQSTTEPTESPTLTATQVYRDALETLSSGDQRGAETILRQAVQTFPRDSRLVFFAAACMRSQWNLSTAALYFRRVGQLDPDGIWGKASKVILDLDGASEQKDKELKALDELSQANLDEPLLMWMVAVECRQQNSNELGVQRYATLLKQWKPGPAMAHQTYANMLDELHRYPDSLLERRLAVQLEPASWTYESLGNTLSQLGNWKEADAAYQAASERSPMSAEVWENWTWSMKARGDKHGQEDKAVMWHWAQQANYDIRDRRARLANAAAVPRHQHSPQAINLYNSVCAHWLENQLSVANSDLRTGMDRFPSDARFPLFLGTSFLANRQYDQARQMLRLAVDTEPTGLAGRTADYLVTMENPLERVANFQAIRMLTDRSPDPLLLWIRATAAMQVHEDFSALAAFVKLTFVMNPGPAIVHTQIADLLDRWNGSDQALSQRQLSAKLDPSAINYQRLAITLGDLQKWNDADQAFGKSTSLQPENPARWQAWAASEQKRGDAARAAALRQKAADLAKPATRAATEP